MLTKLFTMLLLILCSRVQCRTQRQAKTCNISNASSYQAGALIQTKRDTLTKSNPLRSSVLVLGGESSLELGNGIYPERGPNQTWGPMWVNGNFITPQNVSAYEWWPGCRVSGDATKFAKQGDNLSNCGSECCNCEAIEAFQSCTSKGDFKLVRYPSRPGPDNVQSKELVGWWLPGKDGARGPIVIMLHGMGGTINAPRPTATAYLLRSVGLSILMAEIRDHGVAEQGDHILPTWGHEYPYDLLGAWDYVVNDPDNVFGGNRSPTDVAFHAFSFGGLIAAVAFGLEPQVHALLLDAPVWDPLQASQIQISKRLPSSSSSFGNLLGSSLWSLSEFLLGVPVRKNMPSSTITCEGHSGPPRKVQLLSSKADTDIPVDGPIQEYMNLFDSLPECYNASLYVASGGVCTDPSGVAHNHNVGMYTEPEQLRIIMCRFYNDALNASKACSDTSFVPC